jgi:hypothetical protein
VTGAEAIHLNRSTCLAVVGAPPALRSWFDWKVTGSNPVPATKLIKNPSNLNGLLGFFFVVVIDPNNINDLAHRLKSPRNHTHIMSQWRERGSGSATILIPMAKAPRSGSTSLQQFVEWLMFRAHCGPLHRSNPIQRR